MEGGRLTQARGKTERWRKKQQEREKDRKRARDREREIYIYIYGNALKKYGNIYIYIYIATRSNGPASKPRAQDREVQNPAATPMQPHRKGRPWKRSGTKIAAKATTKRSSKTSQIQSLIILLKLGRWRMGEQNVSRDFGVGKRTIERALHFLWSVPA